MPEPAERTVTSSLAGDALVYRILRPGQDRLAPSPLDARDGFIHLSARGQVAGTLAAHFAGVEGVELLAIDAARLARGALRWEVSRGGDRFPHLYGPLPETAIVAVLRPDALKD
jgi:uncharacterized protein (DUF952 family)